MHQPESTGGLKRPRDENVQRWGRTVSPCRDLAIKEGDDAIGEIPNRGVEIDRILGDYDVQGLKTSSAGYAPAEEYWGTKTSRG